jgi:hypothetical protein
MESAKASIVKERQEKAQRETPQSQSSALPGIIPTAPVCAWLRVMLVESLIAKVATRQGSHVRIPKTKYNSFEPMRARREMPAFSAGSLQYARRLP